MSKQENKWMLCVLLILACCMTTVAYAADGTDLMDKALHEELSEDCAIVETVVLGDCLTVSIPEGWEKIETADASNKTVFQYQSVDAEGNRIIIEGQVRENADNLTFADVQKKMEEEQAHYIFVRFPEFDIVFAGDQEVVFGLCLTESGKVLFLQFQVAPGAFSDIIKSEKLLKDVTTIIHSIGPTEEAKLLRIDDSLWEKRLKEQGTTISSTMNVEANDIQRAFFEGIIRDNDQELPSHEIYLNETLVAFIPNDWKEFEDEHALCAFTGQDDVGNVAEVYIRIFPADGMTFERMQADAREQINSCKVTANGIEYLTVMTSKAIVTVWLSEDDLVYSLSAYFSSAACMQSQKLIRDLHEIMCKIRPVFEGEMEQKRAWNAVKQADLRGEKEVSFRDDDFEQMVRTALGKEVGEPVYEAELACVRNISIRAGQVTFSQDVLKSRTYEQSHALDLLDIKLFPNLLYVSITDMACTGFEALANLPDLKQLTLIRTGLTDCSFLQEMDLETLNLSGNEIEDFSVLAKLTGLKSLNLSSTGLSSLDIVQDMDLVLLCVAHNPVSDLSPVAHMTGLTDLYIQNTDVTTLEPLRDCMELTFLMMRGIKYELSLEPLYDHTKLTRIMAVDTKISDEDKKHFDGIVW